MYYSIRHITRFRYSGPVHESVMELRMQPRSETGQTLRNFQITTNPRAQLFAYTDHFGNAVYHFNALRQHSELRIEAVSVVEVKDQGALPIATDTLEWQRYNSFNLSGEHYDLLEESEFAKSSPALQRFIAAHNLEKPLGDPLTALRHLNGLIHDSFEYESGVTQVHSPIAQALDQGRGVCQDFTHIMIAIARQWGVPTRYVSGYLYHRRQDKDRSSPDETHAWMEAYLPSLGWIGFDPTNNILAADRHVRVAVGRDYADVPPTRGTFKGNVESELGVAVRVESTSAPVRHEEFLRVSKPKSAPQKTAPTPAQSYYQQQ